MGDEPEKGIKMNTHHLPINMQVFDLESNEVVGLIAIRSSLIDNVRLKNFIIDSDSMSSIPHNGDEIVLTGTFILVRKIYSNDKRMVFEVLYRDLLNEPRYIYKDI